MAACRIVSIHQDLLVHDLLRTVVEGLNTSRVSVELSCCSSLEEAANLSAAVREGTTGVIVQALPGAEEATYRALLASFPRLLSAGFVSNDPMHARLPAGSFVVEDPAHSGRLGEFLQECTTHLVRLVAEVEAQARLDDGARLLECAADRDALAALTQALLEQLAQHFRCDAVIFENLLDDAARCVGVAASGEVTYLEHVSEAALADHLRRGESFQNDIDVDLSALLDHGPAAARSATRLEITPFKAITYDQRPFYISVGYAFDRTLVSALGVVPSTWSARAPFLEPTFVRLFQAWVRALDRLAAREQREREERRAAQRSNSLTRMVAGVAHEVNTPLGIINTSAYVVQDLLRAPGLDCARAEPHNAELLVDLTAAAQLVAVNAGKVKALVERLKQLAGSELALERATIEFLPYVRNAVTLLGQRLKLTVNLVGDVDAGLEQWEGPTTLLDELLGILLENCAQHAYKDGRGAVELAVRGALAGEGCVFSLAVTDYGVGIPAARIPSIFDGSFSVQGAGKALGLGLARAHGIVTTRLGGRIHCTSNVGGGTSFVIEIPAVAPAPGDAEGN